MTDKSQMNLSIIILVWVVCIFIMVLAIYNELREALNHLRAIAP